MPERKEIMEGLRDWALGSYPEQTAVEFLAGTNEPLTRVWVRPGEQEGRYWLDWSLFDEYSGGLSSGEYATWALARSLAEGELNKLLWSIDQSRRESFVDAVKDATKDRR